MKINYITQQKNAYHKMMELKVSPTERAVYMALFMIWNESGWKKTISVNRQEVMALSGVGSKVTYTNCLKNLDELEFIKYNPSYNPLIGSTIEMYNLCTSNEQVVDKLCTSSGNGSGSGSDTLLKLLNYKTIKLIEDNASLVEDNLVDWINNSKKTVSSKPKSVKEVEAYMTEIGYPNSLFESQQFFDHYESNGWVRGQNGRTKIKDWKAVVRTWHRRNEKSEAVVKDEYGSAISTRTDYEAIAKYYGITVEEARKHYKPIN